MEQRLRCRPREGRGLYRQPRFVQHRRRHVAVPARGAGCIGVVRKKNNFITLLPSPWGARAASTAIPQYLPKGTEVAVPVGGRRLHLEMIPWSAIQTGRTLPSPRGVRVASKYVYNQYHSLDVAVPARGADCIHEVLCGNLRLYVAVPARGAGCITKACEAWLKEHALPSPRGVRVASSLCSMTSTSTTTSCRPREGCGLHRQKIVVVTADSGCRPREGCGLHRRIR